MIDNYEFSGDPARLDAALVHRWLSADAHGVYESAGFQPLENPGRWMAYGRQ
ncbi:hypothetical protein ACTPOK_06335 [Streptomyces inhibens]|uniref:hypothetical protein n=1 Tax=Streptomyces inhibens TaxID=2293571 RepID=UPI00402A862E